MSPFLSLFLHSLQCGGCPALPLYSLQCWGMSLGYSVIYTLHKWAKIMENSKIRIKTNASKREFQVSGPAYFSCPSSTTCQTDSQRAPWQNFWNSDRVKILFPFVLFNLPNKSDDDNEPEENFLPLRDDKTSPPKDEPEKEAKQEGQTGGHADRQAGRQAGGQTERQSCSPWNLLQLLPRHFGVSRTYCGLILPFTFGLASGNSFGRPLPRRCYSISNCSWHNKPNLLIMGK